MSYTHLTEKEIYSIEIYLKEWYNPYQIALKLDRNPSTINREIERNKCKSWKYYWFSALEKRRKLKSFTNKHNKQRIKNDIFLEKYILTKIKIYWSPEQISWRLKSEFNIKISKDTIYKYIYENHNKLIHKYFRRKWKKYQHKRNERYQLYDRLIIDHRPEIINKRERIWDWEWDTMIGLRDWKNKEVIITNVERKSWFLIAWKIENKSWLILAEKTIELFKNIPNYKKLSITYDNWREFSEHNMIKYYTWMVVYFAHPYSSWERWTNENTNWLIRQFFPKKVSFKNITKNQLQYYVNILNSRPRKRLNFLSPREVFLSKKFCTSF